MWHANAPTYMQHRRPSVHGGRYQGDDELILSGGVLFRTGMIALVLLLTAALVLAALDWLLKTENFPVRNVRFEGMFNYVTHKRLEDAVGNAVAGNFFNIDLDKVKVRVEALPWVDQASVRRKWPRDLMIRFSEQRLMMRWGESAWLNHKGEVVQVDASKELGSLPLLQGPEGTQRQVLRRYFLLNQLLTPIALQLSELHLSPRRTWRLVLNNGVILILGRDRPEEKVTKFARAYKAALAPIVANIKQIDLRYTNGFSVQWKKPIPVDNTPISRYLLGSHEG